MQIAHEIESVEENVQDGPGTLDGDSVLALHSWIVPPERLFSKRPSDRPQRHIEQPTLLSSFMRQ
jgi:hypothetical protein